MKLDTEIILKGKVVEIQEGMIMTKVKVDIGSNDIITVIVTDAALKELGATVGEELEVLTTTRIMAARVLH
jgi:molybdopterin-binding protein